MRFVHRWKQLVHDLSFLGPCVLQWKQKGAICLEGINQKALSGSYEQRRVELSADAPIKPPYAVYFQGGLTWEHAKLGVLMSLQKLVDAKIVTLP